MFHGILPTQSLLYSLIIQFHILYHFMLNAISKVYSHYSEASIDRQTDLLKEMKRLFGWKKSCTSNLGWLTPHNAMFTINWCRISQASTVSFQIKIQNFMNSVNPRMLLFKTSRFGRAPHCEFHKDINMYIYIMLQT